MFLNRINLIVLPLMAVLAIVWLAGCGGGSSSVGLDTGTSVSSDSRALSSGSSLPDLPSDLMPSTGTRTSSEAGTLDFTGSGPALLSYSGGIVDGDNLVLTSTDSAVAWALYRADGLNGLFATQFTINNLLAVEGTEYGVGVSNYTIDRWEWLTYTSDPTVVIDLTSNQHRLVSPIGNLYWVVVVPAGGLSVTVQNASIDVDDNGGHDPWRPGGGNYCFASVGLPSVINVEWGVIDGATSYELYRREAPEMGLPGGGDDTDLTDFTLLSVIDTTTYDDADVTYGTWYQYKVKAINDTGDGGYSRPALGMAVDPSGYTPDCSGWGRIVELTADSITLDMIGTQRVWSLSDATLYYDSANAATTWDHFTTGMFAFVKGTLGDPTGMPAAVSVTEGREHGHHMPHGREASACGTIADYAADSFTLTSEHHGDTETLSYALADDTVFFDAEGNAVEWSYFASGMRVFVKADFDDAGARIARSVMEGRDPAGGQPGGGSPGGCPRPYNGSITALDGASITIAAPNGDSLTFAIDDSTMWLDLDGSVIDATQFATGDAVMIFGRETETGLYALGVKKFEGGNPGGDPPPPPA